MKPTPENTDLLLGVIGRALSLLDFELYGYAYLSNHGSMLVGVRSAQHLSRVMNYIHGNIAKHQDWAPPAPDELPTPVAVLLAAELLGDVPVDVVHHLGPYVAS
jgi:hypothetical protein